MLLLKIICLKYQSRIGLIIINFDI
jgi:hypothetical protein